MQKIFALLRPLRIGFRTVVKYRKIPPAAAANQIAENARIPPAADLQKNKQYYCTYLYFFKHVFYYSVCCLMIYNVSY
jgi:hypothetical protein